MTTFKKDLKAALAIPVKIQDKDLSIVTETINITSTGAYCKTAKPLPLLSKVVLTLLVPQYNKKGKVDKRIRCKGTVVRIHPVIVDGRPQSYDAAIYFDELSESDRNHIAQYIEHHLALTK
ncbi:MAG: PilZ domain-containing protein [Candidatus Omnitrophica bacterium]|nr:PilZ domain-containing protein [Candidatus Omnitrophota bacterium]